MIIMNSMYGSKLYINEDKGNLDIQKQVKVQYIPL